MAIPFERAAAAATLTPDDERLLWAMHDAITDPPTFLAALQAYYRDGDRADRTSRALLNLHLGMCAGVIQRLLEGPRAAPDVTREIPDCDCRNTGCGHKASLHVGVAGACVAAGCACGPGGWM